MVLMVHSQTGGLQNAVGKSPELGKRLLLVAVVSRDLRMVQATMTLVVITTMRAALLNTVKFVSVGFRRQRGRLYLLVSPIVFCCTLECAC